MVKGVSRQVIVVQSPDPKLFDQAIFILNDEAVGKNGVTDEMLLKSADRLLHTSKKEQRKSFSLCGLLWAMAGALFTGCAWLLCSFI